MTTSMAIRFAPPPVADRITLRLSGPVRWLVGTRKVTLILPDGTTTVAGTVTSELLLVRETGSPPACAGAFNLTVPVTLSAYPTTVGVTLREVTIEEAEADKAARPRKSAIIALSIERLIARGVCRGDIRVLYFT